MSAILALLARPLIDAFLSAFGRVVLEYLRTWKASEDAKALGRAEAGREATETVLRVEREMNTVEQPSMGDLLKKLRGAGW